MTSADLVVGAEGLLATFNTAGVLNPADVHAAQLIARLWEEPDETVQLGVALAVRALRSGSVCLDIARLAETVGETVETDAESLPWPDPVAWQAALRASPAIAPGPGPAAGQPLRLVGDLLYLERYWQFEQTVRHQLEQRDLATPVPVPAERLRRELDTLFDGTGLPADTPDQQRLAAALTTQNQVTVIAGGPGTGKTTVVAKILALHEALTTPAPVVALAAPTGKAAARLEEAVRGTIVELPAPWSATRIPASVTLHRLLGWRTGEPQPRHTADNPLPHDLVVVDEMSMVSLPQMAALLRALRPEARLVLVGDPDQLASVEAGAVLADITRSSAPPSATELDALAALAPSDRPPARPTGAGVVTLLHNWRFGSEIHRLASAIRAGAADQALAVLAAGEAVRLVPSDGPADADLSGVRHQVVAAGASLHAAALAGDAAAAVAALEQHRVLCAHRTGPFGVARWERQVVDWIRAAVPGYGLGADLYPGQPIMITENDPEVGLFNGDTGVIVQTPQGPRAAFARGGSIPTLFTTLELNAHASVHAMTVHKSQGSQFRRVTLVLPPVESPLLTRELLYTAVTRAREGVEVIGSPEAFARAVTRPANRASGLGFEPRRGAGIG